MRRIIAAFLIALCAVSLFSSCGKKGSADEGYVKVSDGLGNGEAFSVRERKCAFGGGDLVVLYVRNNTEDEYSVTVTGSFFDAEGKEAAGDMAKTRTVFSGLETCYLFRPSAKFDRFEYKLSSEKKDEPSGAIKYSNPVTATVGPSPVDVHEGRENVRTVVDIAFVTENRFPQGMFLDGYLIVFDNKGEIFGIHEYHKHSSTGKDYKVIGFYLDGVMWEDDMETPENLEGALEVAFDFEYSVSD